MSRRTQPYRKGLSRPPSSTLAAMQKGGTATGVNPQDIKRLAAKKAAAHRRRLSR